MADAVIRPEVINVGKRPLLLSYIENQSKNSTNCVVQALLGPKALRNDPCLHAVLSIHIHDGAMRIISLCAAHFPLTGSTAHLTDPRVERRRCRLVEFCNVVLGCGIARVTPKTPGLDRLINSVIGRCVFGFVWFQYLAASTPS